MEKEGWGTKIESFLNQFPFFGFSAFSSHSSFSDTKKGDRSRKTQNFFPARVNPSKANKRLIGMGVKSSDVKVRETFQYLLGILDLNIISPYRKYLVGPFFWRATECLYTSRRILSLSGLFQYESHIDFQAVINMSLCWQSPTEAIENGVPPISMSDVLLRIVTPLLFDLGIKELAGWLETAFFFPLLVKI